MRLTNKWSTLSLAILRFALPAQVVKLVDTLASGASARKGVEVQVLSWAPNFSLTLKVSRSRPRQALRGRELPQLRAFRHRNQALAFVGSQQYHSKP